MAKKSNGNGTPETGPNSHQMAVETLTGDMRDFILDRIKHEMNGAPWSKRSQSEQQDTIFRVETAVRHGMQTAVELIASQGHRAMPAKLVSVTIKDGFKAVLEMSQHDPLRHQLADAQGATVLVVMADMDEFTGERAPAVATPDQGKLPVDAMVTHSETDTAADRVN